MEAAEFDKFADEYRSIHARNIAITGETPEYFAEYKIRDIVRIYGADRRSAPLLVVDLGAGIGASVPYLRAYLPQAAIVCLDVSAKSLQIGRGRFGDEASFVRFGGCRLPLADESIDIAFAACVLHHVSAHRHAALLGELHRVLRRGGYAFVFEHNPWNPLTRRAVDACPFDENAILVPAPAMRARLCAAGFHQAKVRYRVFFPGFVRQLRFLESWLHWLPLGAQYCAWGIKR